jgi:hypothetical protein
LRRQRRNNRFASVLIYSFNFFSFPLGDAVLQTQIVQAEAMRKILGIDSEKKKEEKKLKEREEKV